MLEFHSSQLKHKLLGGCVRTVNHTTSHIVACWEQFVVISCLGTQFVVEFKGIVFTVPVIVMQLCYCQHYSALLWFTSVVEKRCCTIGEAFAGLMTTLELQC